MIFPLVPLDKEQVKAFGEGCQEKFFKGLKMRLFKHGQEIFLVGLKHLKGIETLELYDVNEVNLVESLRLACKGRCLMLRVNDIELSDVLIKQVPFYGYDILCVNNGEVVTYHAEDLTEAINLALNQK